MQITFNDTHQFQAATLYPTFLFPFKACTRLLVSMLEYDHDDDDDGLDAIKDVEILPWSVFLHRLYVYVDFA